VATTAATAPAAAARAGGWGLPQGLREEGSKTEPLSAEGTLQQQPLAGVGPACQLVCNPGDSMQGSPHMQQQSRQQEGGVLLVKEFGQVIEVSAQPRTPVLGPAAGEAAAISGVTPAEVTATDEVISAAGAGADPAAVADLVTSFADLQQAFPGSVGVELLWSVALQVHGTNAQPAEVEVAPVLQLWGDTDTLQALRSSIAAADRTYCQHTLQVGSIAVATYAKELLLKANYCTCRQGRAAQHTCRNGEKGLSGLHVRSHIQLSQSTPGLPAMSCRVVLSCRCYWVFVRCCLSRCCRRCCVPTRG
jgi:hypothetical protein